MEQPNQLASQLPNHLEAQSKQVLAKGSKSFAFASLFFDHKTREAVRLLYYWCRHCDDVTDGSVLGFNQQATQSLPSDRVTWLQKQTALAYEDSLASLDAPFEAFRRVAKENQIPQLYPQDLLLGMAYDANGESVANVADLLTYCYRVAGTVGLMMCHLTGLKDEGAQKNAVDLGIALQLTNIARDIGDDFRAGRVYLPADWLIAEGIDRFDLLNPLYEEAINRLVRRLLTEADQRYASAEKGLVSLPLRAALAVAIAAAVYRAIGTQVIQRGAKARHTRVSLSRFSKSISATKALWVIAKTLPHRLLSRQSVQPVRQIWRFHP